MIEKMTFVTLTGPKYTIDQTVERYLTKYDIHLENAMVELSGVTTLKPFVEVNPYKDKMAVINTPKAILSRIGQNRKYRNGLYEESARYAVERIRDAVTRRAADAVTRVGFF